MSKRSKVNRHRSKRDYAAEYKRRIARNVGKGYSRAIARGHAPKGVIGISLGAKLRVPVGTEIDDLTIRTVNKEGADPSVIAQHLLDRGLAEKELSSFDFTDQETFIKTMLKYGFTMKEAFGIYFDSP